jgi:hypothetical protein
LIIKSQSRPEAERYRWALAQVTLAVSIDDGVLVG